MQARLYVIGIFIVLMGIVIGLVYLFYQQPKTAASEEEDAESLELAGDQEDVLPSSIPSVGEQPSEEQQIQQQRNASQQSSVQGQEMIIDTNKTYSAILETTAGNITIAFHASDTPITVNNFVALAKKDFYDNTIFHRVIDGFMIQGGDPKGDGTGGPGYKFEDEEFEGEYTRGTVAMANAGPNTNGSQFFIMHEDALSMPKNYVIFGEVTEGMDVVDTIATAEVEQSRSGERSKPVDPVRITNVKIVEG